MNSDDLFRKLIIGAKFDYKKFAKDVKKFSSNKTIDSKSSIEANNDESVEDIKSADSQTNGNKLESKTKSKKKKKNSLKSRKQLETELRTERMNHLRKVNRIHVYGTDVSEPIVSFTDLDVEPTILENIRKCGLKSPTPIQMQSIPLMLAKRELICCSPTGSGKTLAFLIPIVHQLRGPQKSGFRAVILAPTRELAKQIHRECLWISTGTGLRVHVIKNVNSAEKKFGLKSGLKFDILVTTPNRLVWLLKQKPKAINIQNVEWLVIDECDKLFEVGFRDQLSVIYQCCGQSSKISHAMFSATHDVELEKWAKMNLDNVVTVIVGSKNSAADLVQQRLVFVGDEHGKILALRDLIAKGCEAPVLIFVDRIDKAKQLFSELLYDGINAEVIHSDRTQLQRDNVVRAFREGTVWFLICTELMGRGIDFKGVNLVINYDFPSTAVSYIHRIGRTGRAGRMGEAITFFTEKDAENLRSIANVMRRSGCDVPEFMLKLNKKKGNKKRKRFNKNRNHMNSKPKKKKSEEIESNSDENSDQ